MQVIERKTQIKVQPTVVLKAYNDGGGLVDAVHDMDLQRVQVWQDLIALGTGVFGNVALMLPVST